MHAELEDLLNSARHARSRRQRHSAALSARRARQSPRAPPHARLSPRHDASHACHADAPRVGCCIAPTTTSLGSRNVGPSNRPPAALPSCIKAALPATALHSAPPARPHPLRPRSRRWRSAHDAGERLCSSSRAAMDEETEAEPPVVRRPQHAGDHAPAAARRRAQRCRTAAQPRIGSIQ